jgi:hypothetical protein
LTSVNWDAESSGTVYLTFRGEADPLNPRMLIPAPGGARGAHMTERLRLAHVGFDLGPERRGLRARTTVGRVAARVTHRTTFRGGRPGEPESFEMTDVTFAFLDDEGDECGTLRAARVAGTLSTFAPADGDQVPQFAGVGPVTSGTGPFRAEGTVLVTGALTFAQDAFSTVYVLRVVNPEGLMRNPAFGTPW